MNWSRGAGLAGVLLAGAVLTAAAAPALSRELAAACAQKIESVMKAPPRAAGEAPRHIPFNEGEINSWLAYSGVERLPVGVTEPAVTLLGERRVSGRAVVDLDLMGKKKGTGGLLDPWSYLRGRMLVVATATLQTEDGVGRFALESAQVSGITVPKWLLQELVSFYARSPSRPEGISIDEPFPLPARIEHVEVGEGQAVITQ